MLLSQLINILPTILLLLVDELELVEFLKVELTLGNCDVSTSDVLSLLSEVVTPPATPAIMAEMMMMSINISKISLQTIKKLLLRIKIWKECGVGG
jgi:hypothetical protein